MLETFWSDLKFSDERYATYRKVLEENGWETLEDYASLTAETLISYAFLAGHAARFMRVVCARASPAAPNSPVSSTSAEVGRAARRVWTWKMVEKESLGYEALLGECPPGDKRKRQGYGLRKFAQFRSLPYAASKLLWVLKLRQEYLKLGLKPALLDAKRVPLDLVNLNRVAASLRYLVSILIHLLVLFKLKPTDYHPNTITNPNNTNNNIIITIII